MGRNGSPLPSDLFPMMGREGTRAPTLYFSIIPLFSPRGLGIMIGHECSSSFGRQDRRYFRRRQQAQYRVGHCAGVASGGCEAYFQLSGRAAEGQCRGTGRTFGAETPIFPCDVGSDEQIDAFFGEVKKKTDRIDLLLHSVAFAPRETLTGEFVATSRQAFSIAHDISAYSLVGLTRAALPFMEKNGGSIVAMSYLGAARVVPGYNVMGVAKASLEASVRYLANDLGSRKIRVNAISAGPMNTLAARGIGGFSKMLDHYEARAPLHRNVELEELGATGLFLASDGAAAITGQTMYVDSGYSVMAM